MCFRVEFAIKNAPQEATRTIFKKADFVLNRINVNHEPTVFSQSFEIGHFGQMAQ